MSRSYGLGHASYSSYEGLIIDQLEEPEVGGI